jgi:hypothetical protein
MNYRMILRVLGMILLIYAELLLLPLIVSLLFGESAMPFLKTMLFAAAPAPSCCCRSLRPAAWWPATALSSSASAGFSSP